jgi:hypothetical protein
MTTPLDPNIQYGPQLPGQPPAWIVANGIRYIWSPPGLFGAPSNFVTPSRADPHAEQVRITNLPKGPEAPKAQGLFGSYLPEPKAQADTEQPPPKRRKRGVLTRDEGRRAIREAQRHAWSRGAKGSRTIWLEPAHRHA